MHTDVQMTLISSLVFGSIPRGVDMQELCRITGLTREEICDAERLLSWESSVKVWEICLSMTGDELLGLRLGQEMTPGQLGMLGYFMQSSRTLGEAFTVFAKYISLVCPAFTYAHAIKGEEVHIFVDQDILWRKQSPDTARQSSDLSMASIIKGACVLTGQEIRPLAIHTVYRQQHAHEYEKALHAPVHFNSDRNVIIFHKNVFELPVITHDRSLFKMFQNIYLEKENAHHREKSFTDRVKQVLLLSSNGEMPSVEIASSHFHITPRSFQRRLKEENTSYRDICKEVKKEIALSLINQSDSKIGAVADTMGYSDPSTFRRAFKSWTRTTPGKVKVKR